MTEKLECNEKNKFCVVHNIWYSENECPKHWSSMYYA